MEEQEGRREQFSEEDVQLLFRAVGRMHKVCLRKEMDRRGLAEVGQPYILFMLRDHQEGMNWDQKQFAEALGVSPATVAISIKRMERAGLVTRVPDPEDLRRNRIAITERDVDWSMTASAPSGTSIRGCSTASRRRSARCWRATTAAWSRTWRSWASSRRSS